MCIQYNCLDCKQSKFKACEHYDPEASKCDLGTEGAPFLETAYRCGTCETIKGVIRSLHILLYKEPWLATEGAAGAPKRESWEMGSEDGGETQPYDSDDDDEDSYTEEERKAAREEAERAVALRWGLLKKEQEQEEEKEHKSN